MKRWILIACVLFLAGCGGGNGTPTPVADFAGNWVGNWGSEVWNGSTTVQKSGIVNLSIDKTGAVKGSFTLTGQSTPVLTLTGQLTASTPTDTDTFTVTDTTTNPNTNYTATGQFGLTDPTNIQASIQSTNSSGSVVDWIDMGLNPQPASAAVKNR